MNAFVDSHGFGIVWLNKVLNTIECSLANTKMLLNKCCRVFTWIWAVGVAEQASERHLAFTWIGSG